ncbi:family 78 glycoside hydrolase catalytic domain [Kitasatospora sp. YST-16]|uniref:family 78 glycoside hydrolase catalytic domain n=1 Tax=Kitasatospora sp. YST-16 TaxID=2998080 RepID=UPI0022842E8B|nr:family 78 glycoside hydrolase catalytic domain [Kitasatospora sp. YST-16]WAL74672.1 family 78 glycoside hydrolase catalytic domain [Kitasatospora sp. YST-16]WNW40727.1 family 78 glycoside hydrolase catalytic domain [Streptomyces sp. Li-HN-5-13]
MSVVLHDKDAREEPWQGHWIGAAPAPVPELEDAVTGTAAGRGFSRVLFRKEFRLDEVPPTAPLRLTADSRFVVWVNGREVGRGPVRAQPRRWRYEEFDIAPHLERGSNAVAVLVTYYGTATSWWYPAPPEGGINGDACLVLDARLGGAGLATDSSWRVHRSSAWSLAAAAGVPCEVLDARELPEGWTRPGFDDGEWSTATVLTARHWGGLGRSRPPVSPFGKLLPRPMAVLGGDTVRPAAVLDARTRAKPAWASEHPGARVVQHLEFPGEPLPAGLPLSAVIGADRTLDLVIDFGALTAGFVELTVDAPAGTVLELGYREKRKRVGIVETTSDYEAGARYVCPGGRAVYSALEPAGLRYLYLTVHTPTAAEVTVVDVAVRENVYPQTGSAYFSSDDKELDRIYRAGIRTVQLNSFDAYTDCPTREQRSWVGDGVVHQMVHLATNEDWRLAEHYVELANSPRSDGILPLSVAGDFEQYEGFTIPDWSLHWVHGVHNLYRHTGDRAGLAKYLPTVERVLRWYEPHLDEHGTLSDLPEWNLVDWSSVFTTGRSSIVSALWARGLAEYAELSDWVGNAGSAAWARARHAGVAVSFEDFWDPDRGLYVDHIVDGERRPAASQAANAAAIVSGLAPTDRWRAIASAMIDPSLVVTRSWIGGDGGYDPRKEEDQRRGIQRIDWDAEREIVRAQPFFSYVVHDAVAQAGLADRIADLVRDWSVFLHDGYDTFGECWGWGTPVHGWSSTPTRDLVVHVLGISPDLPGFERVRIAPRPGRLHEVAGAAPTPHGPVEVRIRGEEITISSPVPIRFLPLAGPSQELPAGSHRLVMRRSAPENDNTPGNRSA